VDCATVEVQRTGKVDYVTADRFQVLRDIYVIQATMLPGTFGRFLRTCCPNTSRAH